MAAPRRVEVEYYQLVRGVLEEGADGRGVDIVNFRGDAGGEGDERPHHLLSCRAAVRWMAAVQSLVLELPQVRSDGFSAASTAG